MNKKIISVFLVSSLIISSFAACGKNNEIENTDTESEIIINDGTNTDTVRSEDEEDDKIILYITGAKTVPFSAEGSPDYKTTSYLEPGTAVELEQEEFSGGYVRVYNTVDKLSGFVSSVYLVEEKSAVTSGVAAVITSDNADIFSEEGGKGTVLKSLALGEEVIVLAKTSGGFWKIKALDDTAGYVSVKNLEVSQEEEKTKSAAESNSDSTSSKKNIVADNSKTASGSSVSNGGSANGNSGSGGGSANNTGNSGNSGNSGDNSNDGGTSVNEEDTQSSENTDPVSDEPSDNGGGNFRAAVSEAQNNVGGNWAAALIVPSTGETDFVNDSQMQAASLIKLYIMGAVYEKYDTFVSQEPNLDTYLYDMITVSDNSAANHLVGILGSGNTDAGKSVVTAYCQTHGYGSTSMGRLLLESPVNGDNYTSVGDCARFLTSVYNGELPHSGEMVNLLMQQTRTSKIPAGVPSGVQTANKTGELDLVQNDAAIVYADTPYILCVMSENVSAGSAVSAIVDISAQTYAGVNG